MDLDSTISITAASCAIILTWLLVIRATYQHTLRMEEEHHHHHQSDTDTNTDPPPPEIASCTATIIDAGPRIGEYVLIKGWDNNRKLIQIIHVPIPPEGGEISLETTAMEDRDTDPRDADFKLRTRGLGADSSTARAPASSASIQSSNNCRADSEATNPTPTRDSTEPSAAGRDVPQDIYDIDWSGMPMPNPLGRRSRAHQASLERHGRAGDQNVQPQPQPQPRNQSDFGGWYGSVAGIVSSRMGYRGFGSGYLASGRILRKQFRP